MDELIRHCLRELSFDGELGCDASRLRDFITEFYAHPSSSRVQGQHVDDAFCAFVWSVIVQQPGVRVGTIPEGGSTEVYIAPQASAIRKAKAKGEEVAEEPVAATGLDIVADAAIRPLEDLRREYGDKLRIAVDPATTFAALTGSHIRPSKLTPMIYSALQLITRGRDNGISVLDLGKKSGYDQKTCFYIIKQLVELGLVVKLRQPGVSTNICVHKYFYERSPIWQQVVNEEKKAVSEEQVKDGEGDSDEESDQEETKPLAPVHFDPIDSRHLSSMPLLRSRLMKLLKNCPHYMHTSNNLMTKIGFVNPTRTERRFFRTRLRELIDQGFIEKVYVPHADSKRHPGKKVSCFRLLAEDTTSQAQGDIEPTEGADVEEIELEEDNSIGLKTNASLHKQMIDRIEGSGTDGMTLNELSAALGDFDRRTIDLLINRLEKDPPPAHLADLGIAQLGETHGRERRYKYYTIAHYLTLADKEQFEDRRYRDVDMSAVGGFLPVRPDAFYEDEATLNKHVKALNVARLTTTSKASAKKRVNPILPDGSVKKGRPRKSLLPAGEEGVPPTPTPARKGRKRKREEMDAGTSVTVESTLQPPAKKRGRPSKATAADTISIAGPSAPRKRGRRAKDAAEAGGKPEIVPETTSFSKQSMSTGPAPKKRGRPSKEIPAATEPRPPDLSATVLGAEQVPGGQGPELPEDVPMQEARMSSPLSSLPPTPSPDVPLGDEEEEGASEIRVSSSEGASMTKPQSELAQGSRAPVDTEAQNFTSRQAMRQSPYEETGPADEPPVAESLVESTLSPNAAPVDILPEPVELPTQTGVPLANATTPSKVSASSGPSNIPIDPALLQTDGLSRLVQDHSLIAMTPAPEHPQPVSYNAFYLSQKRDQQERPSEEPPAKRTRLTQSDGTKYRSKSNISQSRRENEILRLLAETDGIMNTSTKEFYDAHAALMEAITKAGGTASTRPGARIDKRTLDATLKDLEAKGKIKLLTTSVSTLTGSSRMARVAYLPETTSDSLKGFLAELGQSLPTFPPVPNVANMKTLDEPIDYGGRRKRKSRVSAFATREHADHGTQELKATDMALLFQQDDNTIHDALLTEKNTVAQLYGYIVGKAARARALHTLTIPLFENSKATSHIVSHEHRIIHLFHYFSDISVSAYCSLVAVLQPNEELGQLLQSPSGRDTPMQALSDTLRATLAPTQSKSRSRILSLMDLLHVLGVVTPLVPSISPNPTYACAPETQHPTGFDIAPPGPYTPAVAPLYWRFNDIAPIRIWALGEGLPPVWKMSPLSTSEQAITFWSELERVCTDEIYAQEILGAAPTSSGVASNEVAIAAKSLRRTISWSAVYNLSFYQTEYLRRYIDPATGTTPLEDDVGGEAQLNRLSWIISASKDVIVHWFQRTSKKHLRDLRKLKLSIAKGKQKAVPEAADVVLARRAAEAREQRERDWADMLQRVHPGELRSSAAQRVHRVKTRFMQGSAKAGEKWEAKIADAIKEADMVAEKLLSTARRTLFPQLPVAKPALPVPVATSVQEKDVDELIASQGPRVARDARTGRKSRKGKEKDMGNGDVKIPRRHRFLWNRDYDELVRDASAIIKARCRGPTRLDWGAMEQIFPAVPRNSVRQRLVHLKENPGTETYLARLEDKWYDLWVQHRGTEILPDPDPESATDFDLAAHVKFLRKHIDKNSIRVGFVEVEDSQNVELPSSLEDIKQFYDIVEKVPSAPPWDFMWTVVAEEAREKQFAHHAFIAEVEGMPPAMSYDSDLLYVADAAVKMALGNPNETYDPDVASQLLKGIGEEPVRLTTTELLNRGVLAKTVRDPTKSKPGRTLKVSDSNLNSLGGQLPREVFQDASALEELIGQQQRQQQEEAEADAQGQEWPLLATDGDTAFLLELASENKVQFDVDTSHPQSMRSIIDWNSKKADDDDIETLIRVRYAKVDSAGPAREASVIEPIDIEPQPELGVGAEMEVDVGTGADPSSLVGHGQTGDGEPTFCRRASEGLIDCHACLEQSRTTLLQELDEKERSTSEKILNALNDAGSEGITKQQLVTSFHFAPECIVFSVVQRMTEAPIPLAHWTGYTAVVLVAATAIRQWTVTVTANDAQAQEGNEERLIIFPRRWLDIFGRKLNEMWEAAMRAVLGLVLLHPGISQAEIRWRLRSVYDRQEVCEILQTLQEEDYLTKRVDTVFWGGPADDREEKSTFWFLASGGRRWYQV